MNQTSNNRFSKSSTKKFPCRATLSVISRKARKSTPVILFLTLFTLVIFLQPVSSVFAEDGLEINGPARVANTDGDGVRMREGPSTGANSITVIGENELVMIKGATVKDKQGNAFYKIEYDGKSGYAMSEYLIFAGKVSKNFKGLPANSTAKISGTNGDGVNMRQQANSGSSVLARLNEGAVINIIGGPFADKQGNNFYRVNNNGQTGYVSIAYVASTPKGATSTSTSSSNSAAGTYMKVTNTDGDPIRFRTAPSHQADTNGFIHEGEVYKVISGPVKDDAGIKWYKLDRSGDAGYVDGTYLAKTDGPAAPKPAPVQVAAAPAPKPAAPAIQPAASNGPLGQRVVNYARQFLGWRYVWGGSSPAAGGFDCSGFVYWVLSQNGISAGHSVEADLEIGAPVALKDIQPGDILIWANTYKAGPSHSGIYIGGGKFIHAENEYSGVTIDDINDSYYASRYYAARRPGV
ncbi:MAG TPA: SH3 domain-containing C40 family peptidase [Chloroflexia bacterium]|nr:SH3 domain-containing C40 family peptidase [Chloroflexia bacterium]